uniref:Uncharacterized protein n=1 Tax=Anguilla anguilla TaxID=7936 RepID=A0A0E9XS23_ANGAN
MTCKKNHLQDRYVYAHSCMHFFTDTITNVRAVQHIACKHLQR